MTNDAKAKLLFKAKQTVFRMLNLRPRSNFEIRDKLSKKNFSTEIIESTIEYFTDISLIDDVKFAKDWAICRLRRPFGWRRIKMELKCKGIDAAIIDKLQESLQPQDEEELNVVRELVAHKCKSYRNIDRNKKRQRIYGFLVRRGFSSATIMKVLKEL